MTEPTRAQAATPTTEGLAVDENKIIAERREKLQALRQQGVAFPNDFQPTHQAGALHAQYGETDQATLEELARNDENVLQWLEGKEVVKVIVVPKRLVNFVVK